jgi:hypothetical protein
VLFLVAACPACSSQCVFGAGGFWESCGFWRTQLQRFGCWRSMTAMASLSQCAGSVVSSSLTRVSNKPQSRVCSGAATTSSSSSSGAARVSFTRRVRVVRRGVRNACSYSQGLTSVGPRQAFVGLRIQRFQGTSETVKLERRGGRGGRGSRAVPFADARDGRVRMSVGV